MGMMKQAATEIIEAVLLKLNTGAWEDFIMLQQELLISPDEFGAKYWDWIPEKHKSLFNVSAN